MSNLGVWEDAEPGVRRCILNANGSLMMMEVHFTKGAEGYQHQHPHQQMSYCLRGSFTFTIDNEQTTVTQGQSINIPRMRYTESLHLKKTLHCWMCLLRFEKIC